MNFLEKCENYHGLYESDIWEYSKKYILNTLFKNPNPNIKVIKPDEIRPGCLYYIKYNNGGLPLMKFCLCIENSKTKNENGKILTWCININAMTLDSRCVFFSNFFNEQIKKNEELDKVEEEPPFALKGNTLYSYLKTQGYNYIIEPLNIFDIVEIKRISTNVLHYFMFYITSLETNSILKDIVDKLEIKGAVDLKNEIEKLLEKYTELIERYEDNSKEFHKQLKNFETNMKLFKN
jgi:hypothetical protein